MKYVLLFSVMLSGPAWATDSICYGTAADGRLEHGVALPGSGANFVAYSEIAMLAGRTYVHSEVKEIVTAAYHSLAQERPDTVYKYAETGFKDGGQFKPHKTHRNGLSVDFMTPVKNKQGESVHLPTYPWNRFGYDIEFDNNGRYGDFSIDYDALAAHIVALDKAAKARGHTIWRVIFDPQLQPGLFETQYGAYIKANLELSKKRSWVRHDEHYHVDFIVPCAK